MSKLLVMLLAALAAWAQVPEFYRSVDRVTWVVDDLDHVTEGWEKLGAIQVEHRAEVELPVAFRGSATTAKVRLASGFLGDLRVQWIQPLNAGNAFAEYQTKHKRGIFSLVHRIPTLDGFHEEIERLRGLGVSVLQSGEYKTDAGAIEYAYMDTASEGKYVLGLIYLPEGVEDQTPDVSSDRKIIQFAFTVHDLKPVEVYWAKLGLGRMMFNMSNLSNVEYRGKPVALEESFGWQRGRKATYEWIQPVTSPNVFDDHMKEFGEGIHHLGINVTGFDKSVAEWTRTGLKVSSSGWWGNKGKPGSGRFAYIDTEGIGGVNTELTWPFR